MNPYESNTNGPLADAAPLFSSVWLALYYVLRKNFNERRTTTAADSKKLQKKEEE